MLSVEFKWVLYANLLADGIILYGMVPYHSEYIMLYLWTELE